MKVTIAASELKRVTRLLAPITPRKVRIPVLSMMRIEVGNGTAKFSATDLDVEVRVALDAETSGRGTFLVPARGLAAFAAVAQAAVTIRTIKAVDKGGLDRIEMSDGTATLMINDTITAVDYPSILDKMDAGWRAIPRRRRGSGRVLGAHAHEGLT